MGESLFEVQKRPWKLTLTEPVPDILEFVLLIVQKNIFLAKQRGGSAASLHDVVFYFDWRVPSIDCLG